MLSLFEATFPARTQEENNKEDRTLKDLHQVLSKEYSSDAFVVS
jgi:hypothetical protein